MYKGLSCPYEEVGLPELPGTRWGGAGTHLHLPSSSCPSVRDWWSGTAQNQDTVTATATLPAVGPWRKVASGFPCIIAGHEGQPSY